MVKSNDLILICDTLPFPNTYQNKIWSHFASLIKKTVLHMIIINDLTFMPKTSFFYSAHSFPNTYTGYIKNMKTVVLKTKNFWTTHDVSRQARDRWHFETSIPPQLPNRGYNKTRGYYARLRYHQFCAFLWTKHYSICLMLL